MTLTAGGFYSLVREYRKEQAAVDYLLKFKERVERRLGNGSVTANFRDITGCHSL